MRLDPVNEQELSVGIDIGGTFTDAVLYDNQKKALQWVKVPSTPNDPEQGLLHAIESFSGIQLDQITRIVHGITIGTNAVIERQGAETWVVTTKGFKDTLEIARTERRELYNIKTLKPASLVLRRHILEIDERILFDGTVVKSVDEHDIEALLTRLVEENPPAVAVCFLHSYVDDSHERKVADAITKVLPGCFVCSSGQVLPVLREYERFSTTVLNAYIGPRMQNYLDSLLSQLDARGFAGAIFLMTSNGGVVGPKRAGEFPVHTVLSGPAGGVAAAIELGKETGDSNLITCDMGGTSTDVCLIEDLVRPLTTEQQVAGLPNRSPQLAIATLGAGGGSIAWLGDGGIIEVGPRSAGALPGPAAYGRGGEEPTVTDANLCLGRLSSDSPLAGGLLLNTELARSAIGRLAAGINQLDTEAVADGIIKIAVARMVSAIKEISISNGYDPRDFSLVAYGGAGPMHAAFIANEMEIPSVIVPFSPGHFSAFGCLGSDLRQTFAQSCRFELVEEGWKDIETKVHEMEELALASIEVDFADIDSVEVEREFGMRYVGQSWELSVRVPKTVSSTQELGKVFESAYRRRYEHVHELPIECVEMRVTVIGPVEGAVDSLGTEIPTHPVKRNREVYFDGAYYETQIYDRNAVHGSVIGPALIEEDGALTVVPPGWRLEVGQARELRLQPNA
jgi:N-methylhydantoinase A